MGEFIVHDREYSRLLSLILEYAPAFTQSEELSRLQEQDLVLPSVVMAAFADYVIRVAVPRADPQRSDEVFEAIDRLAESGDPEVVTILVIDGFQRLELVDEAQSAFKLHLGRAACALYERWVEYGV